MSAIRVAVAGSEGKMGRTVCEAVEGADGLKLSGRFDTATGGTLEESLSEADVMVDFTTPDSALPNAKTAPLAASLRTKSRELSPRALRTCATPVHTRCMLTASAVAGAAVASLRWHCAAASRPKPRPPSSAGTNNFK